MKLVGITVLAAWSVLAHPGYDVDVERLTAAIDQSPTAALYSQRSERLRLLRRYDEALADLVQAEKLGAAPSEMMLLRGLVLAERADGSAALRELDRYFARGGASALGLRTRARLFKESGRLDDAVADLSRAVRQGPEPEVCLELADAEEARARQEDAARGLEGCLQSLHGAVTVRKRLISIRMAQRDFRRAVELAREAMAGLQVKAEWRLVAADALDPSGQRGEAKAEREAALLELDALVATRAGGYQQLLRARALAGLGRRAEARAQLDAVLAAKPDFEEARSLKAELDKQRVKGRSP
jgi:tetratricopeptide (TPR) repeat protein